MSLPRRETVDLSHYPDLVVIYLGMRVRRWQGMLALMRIGPQIAQVPKDRPDGLLRHEPVTWGLIPPHLGMRQYWRDFDALERWARSEPHRIWWQTFLRDTGGTGFWHETYFMRGGMEALYADIDVDLGLAGFAKRQAAKGPMFSARSRAGLGGTATTPTPVAETDLE